MKTADLLFFASARAALLGTRAAIAAAKLARGAVRRGAGPLPEAAIVDLGELGVLVEELVEVGRLARLAVSIHGDNPIAAKSAAFERGIVRGRARR